MDSNHLDYDIKGIGDGLAEQLLASDSFFDGIFGDPQVIPRVGEEFQAEIPPLVGKSRSLQAVNKPIASEVTINVPNPFQLGLPIPLFWTKIEVESTNGAFENSEKSHNMSSHGCMEYKVKTQDCVLGDGNGMRVCSKLQPETGTAPMDVDLPFPEESKSKLNQVDIGSIPLPGSSGEVWKDIELDSFLLGLYIFGKNLVLVKNFVESKGMGEILSFYYGKFYRSDGYRRWSECQKLRSRRCIHGPKLFTGWRQHEILSRLSSHLSKESQDKLLEVSKTFGEGKISFEEYIFTIKNTVGIGMLIEAIGIGKGKQDLTGNTMEPVKANHVASVRPEIPVGKACSALSSADIIKFLTGDFRLSKARSSDLFWEAVWPRLLARGWHSEQPKDQVFFGSKNSLVFLIPGVKKFSRRKLVKGNHYFDSVSDVLNKVAAEPGLLELEIEGSEGSREKEENKWDSVTKQDASSMSNKRERYLKPRNSGPSGDLIKFTIVDTSLVQGLQRSKVRELRSLPLEFTRLSTPSSISSDSEEDTSDDSENEAEGTSTSNAAEVVAARGACMDLSDCVNSNSNAGIPHTSDSTIVSVENHESLNANLLDDDEEQKVLKHYFSRKVKCSNSKNLSPDTNKQGSRTDCFNEESSCSVENVSAERMLTKDNSVCRSNSPDACEDMVFQRGSQNLSPANSLAKGSVNGRNEGVVTENCLHGEDSPIKSQSHTLIDLNVPQVSMDLETDEALVMETAQNGDNSGAHLPFFQSEITVQPEPSVVPDQVAEVKEQPIMQNRRQSTRSRPLTTKALEALESGYFSPKRKKRDADAPQNNSRKVRKTPVVGASFRNGVRRQ
ncbi:hypothetical protein CCACVL1_22292 [Corchorus capsularis]|uniref:SANT domain-containing protein n=1 Tax=Corchorus capsularis TaxID=210143 RepID=A0A1R3H098_COCAP|nr:hypothetical protein CCACVL1_22292 [Corchorus capsularis]